MKLSIKGYIRLKYEYFKVKKQKSADKYVQFRSWPRGVANVVFVSVKKKRFFSENHLPHLAPVGAVRPERCIMGDCVLFVASLL